MIKNFMHKKLLQRTLVIVVLTFSIMNVTAAQSANILCGELRDKCLNEQDPQKACAHYAIINMEKECIARWKYFLQAPGDAKATACKDVYYRSMNTAISGFICNDPRSSQGN